MIEDLKDIEKHISAAMNSILEQRFKLYGHPGTEVASSLLFDAYTRLFGAGKVVGRAAAALEDVKTTGAQQDAEIEAAIATLKGKGFVVIKEKL